MSASERLLGPEDPMPCVAVNEGGRARLLVVCDHAARAVPARLCLGVEAEVLARHVGWDIGAAAVTTALARRLDAPALLSGYSRLVIDCNRGLDDPTSIADVSDGIPIPGNCGLDASARRARADACFWPYHRAIAARLDRFEAAGSIPAVISIHSFTPVMNGFARPWHIGVLWDKDPRLPVPLIARLSQGGTRVIGDNQPYSARDPQGFTLRRHAEERGLPHALLELRQDEIADAAGAEHYAALLAEALEPLLADPLLYRKAFYQ